MFGLKPHPLYKNEMSNEITIFQTSSYKVNMQEFFNRFKCLKIYIWKLDKDFDDTTIYTLKHSISIPLSFYSFYIKFIYPHLGKCHPDLRSKFYIGKPIEKIRKDFK